MPSGRCVAGVVTFPRPRMSGTCAAWGTGTNARPHGRSPTAKAGNTAMIAAAITAAVETARRTGASVETSTAASARATASATAAVTTAMLSEGGRGEANKTDGDDS